MNEPTTLQNLIDYAQKNNIQPDKCFILLREECMVGEDHLEALVDPGNVINEHVWDDDDGMLPIPFAITLHKLRGIDELD